MIKALPPEEATAPGDTLTESWHFGVVGVGELRSLLEQADTNAMAATATMAPYR